MKRPATTAGGQVTWLGIAKMSLSVICAMCQDMLLVIAPKLMFWQGEGVGFVVAVGTGMWCAGTASG